MIRKPRQSMPSPHSYTEPACPRRRLSAIAVFFSGLSVVACLCTPGKTVGQVQVDPPLRAPVQESAPGGAAVRATEELRTGTSLTREGKLMEALPHLQSARAAGAVAYATSVNLAICYIGTGDYKQAISELENLRSGGTATAVVHNLLAQAWLGDRQPRRAWESFLAATGLTPNA